MKPMAYTYNNRFKSLSLRDLGGGIGFAVTSSFIYRYRAFRRCQTMALAGGFVRLYILNVYETDTMNNKLKKNMAQWKSTGDIFFCFILFCIFAL